MAHAMEPAIQREIRAIPGNTVRYSNYCWCLCLALLQLLMLFRLSAKARRATGIPRCALGPRWLRGMIAAALAYVSSFCLWRFCVPRLILLCTLCVEESILIDGGQAPQSSSRLLVALGYSTCEAGLKPSWRVKSCRPS